MSTLPPQNVSSTAGEPTRRDVLAAGVATGVVVAGVAALGAAGVLAQAQAEDAAPAVARMPSGYIGHGSPMMAVRAAEAAPWRAWGQALPKPVAFLVVSAHFERAPLTLGATRTVPLVYDFGGFPKELYQLQYAAPGAPRLAARVEKLLEHLGDVRRDERRGHDHGTWVPMRWLRPQADVPVLSLSLPTHDPQRLFQIGRALRPLRDEGVFILGSGSLTHNLRRMAPDENAAPFGWAAAFDAWADDVIARGDVDALLDWQRKAPDARTNHPTVEHFIPLILAMGTRHDNDRVRVTDKGFEHGGLSRRSFAFETV